MKPKVEVEAIKKEEISKDDHVKNINKALEPYVGKKIIAIRAGFSGGQEGVVLEFDNGDRIRISAVKINLYADKKLA